MKDLTARRSRTLDRLSKAHAHLNSRGSSGKLSPTRLELGRLQQRLESISTRRSANYSSRSAEGLPRDKGAYRDYGHQKRGSSARIRGDSDGGRRELPAHVQVAELQAVVCEQRARIKNLHTLLENSKQMRDRTKTKLEKAIREIDILQAAATEDPPQAVQRARNSELSLERWRQRAAVAEEEARVARRGESDAKELVEVLQHKLRDERERRKEAEKITKSLREREELVNGDREHLRLELQAAYSSKKQAETSVSQLQLALKRENREEDEKEIRGLRDAIRMSREDLAMSKKRVLETERELAIIRTDLNKERQGRAADRLVLEGALKKAQEREKLATVMGQGVGFMFEITRRIEKRATLLARVGEALECEDDTALAQALSIHSESKRLPPLLPSSATLYNALSTSRTNQGERSKHGSGSTDSYSFSLEVAKIVREFEGGDGIAAYLPQTNEPATKLGDSEGGAKRPEDGMEKIAARLYRVEERLSMAYGQVCDAHAAAAMGTQCAMQ